MDFGFMLSQKNKITICNIEKNVKNLQSVTFLHKNKNTICSLVFMLFVWLCLWGDFLNGFLNLAVILFEGIKVIVLQILVNLIFFATMRIPLLDSAII